MTESVAVLGPAGTFSEQAAKRMYPLARIEYLSDVGDVFEYVADGRGDGVAALENSLEGSVDKTMESLLKYDLKIVAEATLDIRLHMMAKKGVKREDVKVIVSHPHVFGQCKEYLDKNFPKAKKTNTSSTAEAIIEASDRADAAAIGFREAGLRYGLHVLAENIQDQDSQTRFIALSKSAREGPKTSLIFSTKDEPGALFSIMKLFADESINLTKIESRPSRKKLGEYVFYLDYENNSMKAQEREQLHARINERTTYFKDLGSY
ncbi:MAG: prephenate dehydratase [Candidatus Altiarchaeota archaeon]